MALATSIRRDRNLENDDLNGQDGETRMNFGEDDENMVSSSKGMEMQGYSIFNFNREKRLRYRTRVFAAECLSHLPAAVGKNPAHFDLSLARKQPANEQTSGDWLVLHVQELISVAYQISTIQFENMQPIGVELLSTIIDKFEMIPDPELPGHLLLEQNQAQLVSAVRTALGTSSGPILLEAGLHLATKILTSGIISGDQAAVKRIFSLISRPLNEFHDLDYPSFAEWVSCKIKIRLLAAHASLKCYTYAFLRRHHSGVPDEYLALLPLFSKSSSILGKYWIQILKDYTHIFLGLQLKKTWNSFVDGIHSLLVSSKLQPCLEESWPVILQALTLDAVPMNHDGNGYSKISAENISTNSLISGYSMVELESEDYRFLWGFALLVLFQGQHPTLSKPIISLGSAKAKYGEDLTIEEMNPIGLKLHDIVLPVFQFLSTERFFSMGFLTIDICQELLQVFSYSIYMDNSWNSLAISVLSQIVQNCCEDFLETEHFTYLAMELSSAYLFKLFQSSTDTTSPGLLNWEDLISPLFITAKTLVKRIEPKKQSKSVVLAFLLIGYRCIKGASTESRFSKVEDYVKCTNALLRKLVDDEHLNFQTNPSDTSEFGDNGILHLRTILGTCLNVIANLIGDCIESIHLLKNKRSDARKLLQMRLSFALEQAISFAKLAHEIECLGTIDGSPIFSAVFKYCSKCIRSVLADSNIQVQAIGLQVLKSMVQRGTNIEDNTFLIFFVGELVTDIFTIIQKTLRKPVSKESEAIAGECLRILVLLQTLSKANECQRGFMNLFLEAVVMVFSASEDGFSQEDNDIRSTAVRLVSHLAQIPSSAVYIKDVLLSMSVTHRQQLQEVIRASITPEPNPAQMKPLTPSLEIKLPAITESSKEKDFPPSATTSHSNKNMGEEDDDDDDDDDWDAFQSFPASRDPAGTGSKLENVAEEINDSSVPGINSGSDDFVEYSSSQRVNDLRETDDAKHKDTGEEEVISDAPESEESEGEKLSQEKQQASKDLQTVEKDAEGSINVNLSEDHVPAETPAHISDQASSNVKPIEKISEHESSEEDKQMEADDEDAGEKAMAENESTKRQQESGDSKETVQGQEESANLESPSEINRT